MLCKRTFFNGLDGTLIGNERHYYKWHHCVYLVIIIDTKIAGNIVNIFATTLQSTVASRMKTVCGVMQMNDEND